MRLILPFNIKVKWRGRRKINDESISYNSYSVLNILVSLRSDEIKSLVETERLPSDTFFRTELIHRVPLSKDQLLKLRRLSWELNFHQHFRSLMGCSGG